MLRNRIWLLGSGALVALATVFLAACSVPLAPGYAVQKESLDVRYVPGDRPHLAIRASYQLKNVGTATLSSIEVTIPNEKSFGRQNLRAELNGHSVPLSKEAPAEQDSNDKEPIDNFQLAFDPPWPRGKNRSLVIEYDLAASAPGRSAIAVNGDAFHLGPEHWFPDLQSPKKLFAHDVERPDPTPFNVRVPDGFLVLSAVSPARVHRRGGEVEYRYVLHKFDINPFLVAGRYHEQQVNAPDGSIIFWTLEPLAAGDAQIAGARFASSMKAYATAFGSVSAKSAPAHIVETPTQLYARSAGGEGPAGWPFFNGAVLNRPAFALGVSSETFLTIAEHELAHTWLAEQVELSPEAEIGMGEGFAEYAPIVSAEARGGAEARRSLVEQRLRLYDEAHAHLAEKLLVAVRAEDKWEQRKIAYAKGSLFFVALEDECGEAGARRGIAHLISALRGESAGFPDLRAAIEMETGKNLADFFRIWLFQAGIPEDFRSRYKNQQ